MLKFNTSCAVLAYLSSDLLNEVGLSLFRYFEVGLYVCAISSLKSSRSLSHLLMSSCKHKTIARQVLRIKSGIYESARNLYRGRRAVPLQTFTTRHSNRKWSIVMALSTTFTQYFLKLPNPVKITQNKGHFAVRTNVTDRRQTDRRQTDGR